MAGESKTTTDHDEIRRWVEERGGRPAAVKETGNGDDPGILRSFMPAREGRDDYALYALTRADWERRRR